MKTIIRNFINVLIRFKVATILNVAGLAVAFAAFLIIMMQVSFERNFDDSDSQGEWSDGPEYFTSFI